MNETTKKDNWDFIIVGAGICGLSLGALLVNDGYKVLILEKAKNIGGRAKVVEKQGYTLDFGIHTVRFGKKSSLAKTLSTIRRKNEKKIKFIELGISYFFLETDGEPHWEVLPTGLSGITKGKYFSISKLKNVLFKLMMAKKKKNLNVSVKTWQDKKDLNIQGQTYLKLVTGSMQVCPFLERASLGELRRNLQEVIKKRISVTYPVGGWKMIFDRLTNKISKDGGEILTSHEVTDLISEDSNIKGVKCNDKEFYSNSIIISVPVQDIFSFVDGDRLDKQFADLCKNLKPTAGLSLDIGLNKKISDETGLFYFEDPISFGFFTSNIDTECVPEGKQLLTMCVPFDNDNLKNKEFCNDILEKLRNKLFLGFPDLKENIDFERPLFTIFDGAEVNIDQYKELRPQFKVPGFNNLYLVGDSTGGSGAGGDIGHNSVWDTYSEIKRDYKE